MPSTYAVLYSTDGSFLLAFKAARGYYFGDGDHGDIYRNGVPLNGANNWALPGGASEPGETIAQAAYREFWEETALFPRTSNISSQQFTDPQGHQFAAAYFAVDVSVVPQYVDYIAQTTLPISWQIANAIASGTITAYDQINAWVLAQRWNIWPPTNELHSVYEYNILDQTTWAWIQTWESSNQLNWYYYVLAYLRTSILNAPTVAVKVSSPQLTLHGSEAAPPSRPSAGARAPEEATVRNPPGF